MIIFLLHILSLRCKRFYMLHQITITWNFFSEFDKMISRFKQTSLRSRLASILYVNYIPLTILYSPPPQIRTPHIQTLLKFERFSMHQKKL
jgi:hypothetical protein